jgi:hypothetical protein
LLTDDDSQTGGAILAGLTGAAGGAASGSSLASTPLGGTPLTTPGGTPRSNSPLKGLNPSMGGVGPTAAGTGSGEKHAAKAKREAEKAAAALAEAKKKHAAELARLKADQAAAIAKASDKRAKELAAEHERKLEEMRQVHAADVEKRGGALKTTRVQLQETSAQVAKLRELHEKSAVEARTADAASRRADDRARVAREAREATLRALQDAVSLAVASGAAEADIRKSMRKHGVVLLNENGELRVAEGDAGDGGSSVSVSDHGVAVSPASTKSAAEVSKTVEGEMDAIAQKYIAGEMGGKKKTGGIFGFGSKKK